MQLESTLEIQLLAYLIGTHIRSCQLLHLSISQQWTQSKVINSKIKYFINYGMNIPAVIADDGETSDGGGSSSQGTQHLLWDAAKSKPTY